MTRPKLLVGVLAAACGGTLLWYAWLILVSDLPRGATVATWALWLVSTAAVVTLLAYLREFLTHRQAVGREATWKPLPGLVLLWIGGVTALVAFAFILPGKGGADGAPDPAANTSLNAQTIGVVSGAPSSSVGSAADSPRTTTTASRSKAPRTTPPAPASTTAPRVATRTQGSTSSTTRTRTPSRSTSSSSTSSPLLDITLPGQATRTRPPGR